MTAHDNQTSGSVTNNNYGVQFDFSGNNNAGHQQFHYHLSPPADQGNTQNPPYGGAPFPHQMPNPYSQGSQHQQQPVSDQRQYQPNFNRSNQEPAGQYNRQRNYNDQMQSPEHSGYPPQLGQQGPVYNVGHSQPQYNSPPPDARFQQPQGFHGSSPTPSAYSRSSSINPAYDYNIGSPYQQPNIAQPLSRQSSTNAQNDQPAPRAARQSDSSEGIEEIPSRQRGFGEDR
ncbi:hypothetical protein AMATHDRAFT_50264 [Amanita thiersii Skay4041]|uniref:Uncharacterized protein n=1 Tax=Amanita thiersii Skay4041 TaxID=703135 RepID=A0A2A9NDW9_9AGAR|nr:hypothetical protein AMATHDRAFT_50264 [Amanita thiersii Skay4041]